WSCSNSIVGFDLQDHIDTRGNAVSADFVWVAQPVTGVAGISTTPQSGDFIIDQLVNNSLQAQRVVYTVTPTSTPEGCVGDPFTVTVRLPKSARVQALPANMCLGDRLDIATLVRDYGVVVERFDFFDGVPGAPGTTQVGSVRAFRGAADGRFNAYIQPTAVGVYTYYVVGVDVGARITCTDTTSFTVTVSNCQVALAAKALLEGAYESTTGQMRDALRSQQLVPTTEPYTSLGYTFVQGGGEQIQAGVLSVTGPNAITDWVIVELRSSSDSTQVVYSRSALAQRDGDIVDVDGVSTLDLTAVPAGNYFVAVIHRNHLGSMTAQPVSIGAGTTNVDFSDPNLQVHGGIGSRCVHTSGSVNICLLYSGDADGNGQVQNVDNVLYWMPTVGTAGYKAADYNLDGQVQNSDFVRSWMPNAGRGGSVPR
ncbi:MAG: PKD-like domain-containing protein, partial [Rhodothermales bacterium]